tara:strand:+ start:996 stop:2066 length:1071 start_codon:yes stop_codon:yes gene_type:complete
MARVGLYLVLKIIVNKKKNIIIMSPFTIFDIVNKILSSGATPRFVDSYKYQPHISFKEIKKAYNKNVVAVLVTHYHSCHPEIDKIKKFCNLKKIYLIEDCAISLGSKFKGKYVGNFGDFAIFSFGVYKFISTPLGGMVRSKTKKNYKKILKLINPKNINFFLLFYFFIKGGVLKFLMNNSILKFIIKKTIKFGIYFNIKFIDKILNNDPNPKKNIKKPFYLNTNPSKFQIYGIHNQLQNINPDLYMRSKNAKFFEKFIKNKRITKPKLNFYSDPILSYPILSKNKNKLYKKLILNNFDISNYFYRNCGKLNEFKKYKSSRTLNNIDFFSKHVLCLPVYPGLNSKYIQKLSKKINEF